MSKRYRAAHDKTGKRYDPVLGNVSAGRRTVRKSCDDIKQGIDRKRHQYPELDISIYGLADIISEIVIDEYRYLERYAYDGHREYDPLKFQPYRSFQVP